MDEKVAFARELRAWMRRAVFLQDKGFPVGEECSSMLGLSCSHALMVQIDIERSRMVFEGLPVQKRPDDPDKAFIIGFPHPEPSIEIRVNDESVGMDLGEPS